MPNPQERKPQPGDIRIASDGFHHSAEVFTPSGWQMLRGVAMASILVSPGVATTAQLTIAAFFLDVMVPEDRANLVRAGLPEIQFPT